MRKSSHYNTLLVFGSSMFSCPHVQKKALDCLLVTLFLRVQTRQFIRTLLSTEFRSHQLVSAMPQLLFLVSPSDGGVLEFWLASPPKLSFPPLVVSSWPLLLLEQILNLFPSVGEHVDCHLIPVWGKKMKRTVTY